MNIIPFPEKETSSSWEYCSWLFSFAEIAYKKREQNGVHFHFEQELKASVSPQAIVNYFQSVVWYNLMIPQKNHGFEYFCELLQTLRYAEFSDKNTHTSPFPEPTMTAIHKQVWNLSIFECKNLIVRIDKIVEWLTFTPHLRPSYNYIRSVIFTRFEELRKKKKET